MKKIILSAALLLVGFAAYSQNLLEGSDDYTLTYESRGFDNGVDSIKYTYRWDEFDLEMTAWLLILDSQVYVDHIYKVGYGVYAIARYHDGFVRCYPLEDDGSCLFKEYFDVFDDRFKHDVVERLDTVEELDIIE